MLSFASLHCRENVFSPPPRIYFLTRFFFRVLIDTGVVRYQSHVHDGFGIWVYIQICVCTVHGHTSFSFSFFFFSFFGGFSMILKKIHSIDYGKILTK